MTSSARSVSIARRRAAAEDAWPHSPRPSATARRTRGFGSDVGDQRLLEGPRRVGSPGAPEVQGRLLLEPPVRGRIRERARERRHRSRVAAVVVGQLAGGAQAVGQIGVIELVQDLADRPVRI